MKKLVPAVILAVAALALTLTGCSSDTNTPEPQMDAARFVACLTAHGVEAKVSDRGGYVMVRQAAAGDGLAAGTGSSNGGETLYAEGDADGTSWLAVSGSMAFADDPTTQDAYGACEAEYPSFRQPEYDPTNDPENQEQTNQNQEAALAFTGCARDAGFAWVADPDPSSGGGILVPGDVTEDEFRALLDACYDPQGDGISWVTTTDDQPVFDLFAVLDDVSSAQ